MDFKFIHTGMVKDVAILELSDPPANTLTYDLVQQLEEVYFDVLHKSGVKAILITGRGDRFFSGGVNIPMLLNATPHFKSNFLLYASEVFELFRSSPTPVVAAINGHATGGGLELALAARHRVAIKGDYNLGFPEVRLGVIPGLGGTSRLGDIIGSVRALRLITKGEFITDQEALEFGLVERLLPREGFLDAAIDFCLEVAMTAPARPYQPTGLTRQRNINDYTTLEVDNGIATIGLKPTLASIQPRDALYAINTRIVAARADENTETLLITCDSGALPLQGEMSQADLEYMDFVFRRLESWPRLCAIQFDGPLSPLGFELALACDYRFCTDGNTEHLLLTGKPVRSQRLVRHERQIEASKITLAQAAEKGFIDLSTQDDTKAFLATRVPPDGASTAIGYAKLSIRQSSSGGESLRLLLERFLQENIFKGPDSNEGMKAYMEKRNASFIGK